MQTEAGNARAGQEYDLARGQVAASVRRLSGLRLGRVPCAGLKGWRDHCPSATTHSIGPLSFPVGRGRACALLERSPDRPEASEGAAPPPFERALRMRTGPVWSDTTVYTTQVQRAARDVYRDGDRRARVRRDALRGRHHRQPLQLQLQVAFKQICSSGMTNTKYILILNII